MNARSFRFGVSLLNVGSSRSGWRARVQEAGDLGYDVLQVPDHLGAPAPFPALVAAADVTGIRLGTYVLNVGVVSPAYLARDVADTYRLTDGRLELGLGAGYVPEEFAAAGLSFGTPGSRLRKLEEVLTRVRELLAAEADTPRPPIMLAGAGDRTLTLAARSADIISFSIAAGFGAGTPEQALGARVQRVREAAGERIADIELNLFVAGVGHQVADIDLSVISSATGMSAGQLAELPGVLVGSPRQIADTLLRYREEFGISYISVLEGHMRTFAEVIPLLR
ncbi:TIGR03621 family F420-dependent LLM class oxidoreductase [Streptosporangium sp. 'caverna']|uniref:TIGR03621 family F420-dependent LLM class oxidoreductase n=1 Tax=Streptosporangium sp. 'caverna' TaxID=2202249 RepID=UPI000D7E70E6|nr:TIGR03621 family F420-dependent LLM class oxidoreductase [Streptosporangium sp. 'caverna']AWS40339.1 LLM class F420-dependent oxidoreductase [Streptosporangium sp. 'caverna']